MQLFMIRGGIILLALIFTIIIYFMLFPKSKPQRNGDALWDDYQTIEKEVDGRNLTLVVADTSARWQQGLMHVRKPVAYDGMIFTSNTARPQVFWNMNTFEDLDIYWLRNDEVIGKSFLPSIEKKGMTTVSSPGPADTVIEVIR